MIERCRRYIKKWWVIVLAIGSALGILNNYPSFINNIIPIGDFEENIEGIWLSEYSYPIANGSVDIIGTTEYFKNRKYNFVGEIGINVVTDESKMYVLYLVDGAGIWQADSESINITLNDIQSVRKSVTLNGETVDANVLKLFLGDEDPFKEFAMPSGTSEEYEIIDLANDTIIVEADDPAGNMFEFEMTKQSKRFQR